MLISNNAATDAYESLFAQVLSVNSIRFLEADPTAVGADDEFYVSGDPAATCEGASPACTLVGDFLYDGDDDANNLPTTTPGERYLTITGIVDGYNDTYTLDVRVLDDLVPE